jgi:hypothetical protein
MRTIYGLEGQFHPDYGSQSITGEFWINKSGKIHGLGKLVKQVLNHEPQQHAIVLKGNVTMLENKVNLFLDFPHELNFAKLQSLNGADLTNLGGDYLGEYYYRISGQEYVRCCDNGKTPDPGAEAKITIIPLYNENEPSKKFGLGDIYRIIKKTILSK